MKLYLDVTGGGADDAVQLALQRLHQGGVLQHLGRKCSGPGLLAHHLNITPFELNTPRGCYTLMLCKGQAMRTAREISLLAK